MGFDISANVTVREKAGTSRPATSITCPRCGATNPVTTNRCRSCLTTLPSKAPPKPAPRTVSPTVEPRKDVDSILGELEALTREDDAPAVRFQCPECGRLVDEAATRCRCGAIFEAAEDVLGYACPLCGTRVPADAPACRCGARFSD